MSQGTYLTLSLWCYQVLQVSLVRYWCDRVTLSPSLDISYPLLEAPWEATEQGSLSEVCVHIHCPKDITPWKLPPARIELPTSTTPIYLISVSQRKPHVLLLLLQKAV